MADVAFVCPECGHTYQFAAHLAGKRGRCKQCRAVFRIPAAPPETARVPTAPSSAASPGPPIPRSRPVPQPSRTSPPAPAVGGEKIVLHCPSCGHGYALDAKLAGKQGRCMACRAVFQIPAPRPATPAPARGPNEPPPAAPAPDVGDSGWWELDSSESIPAVMARPGAAAMVATRPARPRSTKADPPGAEGLTATAGLTRPRWFTYAAIAAGVLAGSVAYAVVYSLVSNALGPSPPAVADRPEPAEVATPPTAIAEVDGPKPDPSPPPSESASRHREAIEALARAYHAIADGYARIRDAGSIPQGREAIDRGAEALREAARRGRALPRLSPDERREMARWGAPILTGAIDRVLVELRRLRGTPGLRSEFDRLIDAYTRAREEVRRELGDRP